MATHKLTNLSDTPYRITSLGSHSGMDITIQNVNSSGYIYIGGDDTVNSENYGYRIAPNNAWSVELPGNDALYAMAEWSGLYIAVMQVGLEGNI